MAERMVPIVPQNPQQMQGPPSYGTWTVPGANLDIYRASSRPAYLNILDNPYLLQTLAAAGQAIDPEGVGGILGAQAQRNISSRQAAKANERAVSDANDRFNALMAALRGPDDLTPKGQRGLTSMARKPDGSLALEMDTETTPEAKPPPKAPDRDITSSVPTATVQQRSGYGASAPSPLELVPPKTLATQQLGPVPATSIGPTRSRSYYNINNIIPFWRAPLR